MRDLEAVDKVRETDGIRMVIGEILRLFAYIACPLLILPHKMWSQPQIDYAVTSIGVDLHRITTNIYYGYWKAKFREASWNKLNLGGANKKLTWKQI